MTAQKEIASRYTLRHQAVVYRLCFASSRFLLLSRLTSGAQHVTPPPARDPLVAIPLTSFLRVLPAIAAEYLASKKQKMKRPTFRCAIRDGYPENWSIAPDMNNNSAMEYAARNNQRGRKS